MKDSTFNAWTGLNDVNSEHTFLWTDGRGVHYTNWGKGYPGGRRSSLSYEDVNITSKSPLYALSVCLKSSYLRLICEKSTRVLRGLIHSCRSELFQTKPALKEGVQIQLRTLQCGGGKASSMVGLGGRQEGTGTQRYQLPLNS